MRSPFENKSLIEWLDRQPEGSTYLYVDYHDCLICQYFVAMGLPAKCVGTDMWIDTRDNIRPLPPGWDAVSLGDRTQATKQQLFSDAAKRAHELLTT